MKKLYVIKYVKGLKGVKTGFYAGRDKKGIVRFIKENDDKRKLTIKEYTDKKLVESELLNLESLFKKGTFEVVEHELEEEQVATEEEQVETGEEKPVEEEI